MKTTNNLSMHEKPLQSEEQKTRTILSVSLTHTGQKKSNVAHNMRLELFQDFSCYSEKLTKYQNFKTCIWMGPKSKTADK